MAKIIGMMCVKDEEDLLPEVYPHVKELVDELYVYDDGSIDNTWDIVKDADYAIRKQDDVNRPSIHRPNYHRLLEKIKERHDIEKDDVWVVITMGDRFFLNKTPRQIVAEASGFQSVEGIQLDFLRHRLDPWTEHNDTYPNWTESLRYLCRWVRLDERCIVAYKVTKDCSYRQSKYPWPKTIGIPQYEYNSMNKKISLNMPFLEHQGRRSPKAAMWRYASGSRPLGRKYQHYDLSTFDSTVLSMTRLYSPYRLFPWTGLETLNLIVDWENEERYHDRVNQRWFFKGAEMALTNVILPKRRDI